MSVDPILSVLHARLDWLERTRPPADEPPAPVASPAPAVESALAAGLAGLQADRAGQNSALMALLPGYLEAMADSLSEMEPRLAQPAKRKKWAAKITAKIADRLPSVTAPGHSAADSELERLIELEKHNQKQVASAMHRIEGDADVMRVLYALEGCKGSSWRARCEAEGIAVPEHEPTDFMTKMNENLKQWYNQVVSEDRWRYAFFRSKERTTAYAAAIERAAAGKRVVDVGVGSGLLAMLAAGVASEVITIESSKTAAAAVEKAVAASGLSGKVKVVRSVKEAVEMASRDDMAVVLTVEMLAAVPITAELHTALELAKALGTQVCQLIPQSAELFAAPAQIPPQRVLLECPLLHAVCGFDLTLFNEFRLHKPMPHALAQLEHSLLAPAQSVFELDLSDPSADMAKLQLTCDQPGEWNAVVSWYELRLDAETCVSSSPEQPDALQAIQYLPGPFEQLESGAPITFNVLHNGSHFGFSFNQPSKACENEKASLLRWHWGMLNDEYRNGLYNEAIQAAVARKKQLKGDDMLVLDIGTGSGLLSMMCARAGVQQVVAVEAVEPLAAMARRIISANGYDCVSVHNKMSTALELGVELPRPADLLVSEIVDVALLGEHMVPAVADATERLLAPDVVMIPCAAKLIGCLLQVPAQPGVPGEAQETHGLSLDTELTVPSTEMYQQMLLNRVKHTKLSQPFDVFHFDFYQCAEHNKGLDQVISITAIESGTLDAVGLWFDLQLDEERTISTAPAVPPEKDTCWQQALMWLPGDKQARTFQAGDTIKLHAKHDGVRIRLSL